MKGNFKSTTALALLDSTKVAAPAVKKFGDAVANQFGEIARTDKMNAARAIMIGIALPILKASMPRGEFMPWQKANLTKGTIWSASTALKNASLYTRLALVFLEKEKPSAPEVLALTAGKAVAGKIQKTDAHAAQLFKRIDSFVGENSINELLVEHGIKDGSGGGSSSSGAAEVLPADDSTLLQDTSEWLLNLRRTVVDPDTLKRFSQQQIAQLDKDITETLADFRKARDTLAGK